MKNTFPTAVTAAALFVTSAPGTIQQIGRINVTSLEKKFYRFGFSIIFFIAPHKTIGVGIESDAAEG